MTPELFSDRGVAWIKAFFEVAKVIIDDFGILALALLAVMQNVWTKADSLTEVKARLDRQGAKIDNNTQAITQVALAVPTVPEKPSTEPQDVVVVNKPDQQVPVIETKTEPENQIFFTDKPKS